jgi:poly(A) polymerase
MSATPYKIPRDRHSVSRRHIDADAIKVLYRLYRAGHTAYLVGGGVRDLLLGRKPKDFDIVTSARPAQVKRLFRNCRLIGRRFRLAHLIYSHGKLIELSTFRANPEIESSDEDSDLLVVDDNLFGTPQQDAERRDFTINSLFYDIGSFSLIDYVGGLADLQSGIVRTIGDPMQRFQEDPVRMIRAIKFAARLEFAIEDSTWQAMLKLAPIIDRSAPSRVSEELGRLLEEGSAARSLELMAESGLLKAMDPNLETYLRMASRGDLDHDPQGDLPYRLLRRCDQLRAQAKLSRAMLFCTWVLPIALMDGLLDDEEGYWAESVSECTQRLGVGGRDYELIVATLTLFRRLALRKKRKRGQGRPLEEREGFPEALRLLEFFAAECKGYEEDYRYWLERAPKPAERVAASPRPPQNRRVVRRRGPRED